MARLLPLAVGLLLVAAATRAQEVLSGADHRKTAARVLAAHRAGDAEVLSSLAREDGFRPWEVADALLADGHRDAALALARAGRGADVEALPSYLSRWKASEKERQARALMRRVAEAQDAGKSEDALAILASAPQLPPGIPSADMAAWRGKVLNALDRPKEAEAAYLRCRDLAEEIGWLQRAASACLAARNCAFRRGDVKTTIRLCEEALTLQRGRGERVLEGLIHVDLSAVLRDGGKLDESRAHLERARALLEPRAAEDPDAARGLAWGLANLGGYEAARDMQKPALTHLDQALGLMRDREDHAGVAFCLVWVGKLHVARGRTAEARKALEEALVEGRSPGAGGAEGYARSLLGELAIHRSALREALDHLTRAREVFRIQQNPAGEAVVAADLAWTTHRLGRAKESRAHLEAARALVERIRPWPVFHVRGFLARTLWRLGNLRENLGEYEAARARFAEGLSVYEAVGSVAGRASCLDGLALVHWRRAEFREAIEAYQSAKNLHREVGDLLGEAQTLCNMGLVHDSLGAYQEALSCFRKAKEIDERVGRAGSTTLQNLGMVQSRLGRSALSLSLLERALRAARDAEDLSEEAHILRNLALVHSSCGDLAKAREMLVEAEIRYEKIGDPRGVARSRLAVALLHQRAGEARIASSILEEVIRIASDLGDPHLKAEALSQRGWALRRLGEFEAALEALDEARRIQEAIGDRAGVLESETGRAAVLSDQGRHEEAVALLDRVVEEADRLGHAARAINALGGISEYHLRRKAYPEVIAAAREGVRRLGTLLRGFGEEQGASRREEMERTYMACEEGIRAAAALGRAPELCFFLESSRAGGLLESLGGRERMRGVAIPKRLRDEDTEARATELVARRDISERVRKGEEPTEAEQRALRTARARVAEVVEKIQREAKLAASVVYPEPDSLETIQGRLRDGEALVLYGVDDVETVALVLSAGESRVVRLGASRSIDENSRQLVQLSRRGSRGVRLAEPATRSESTDALATALRARVVDPLKLGESVTRVLVSADGALSAVPFCLLLRDREVAYVPSGTAYGTVWRAGLGSGRGVLSLGDPVTEGRLERLPGSAVEARAVGEVVLLREKATETALRATLGTRPRWRSLHFACHGLVDPASPQMSSLALTPDAESDGFLTAMEVFDLGVAADLVALSACRTGRGKVYAAEGVLGLTRAFIVAGAPRVLCSLWDVPDDATRELMVRFYALWNPPGGGEGLPAARALRLAQAHVRNHPDHPGWKAPYYWAAWMLWGQPE